MGHDGETETRLTIPPLDLIAFDPGENTGVCVVKEGKITQTFRSTEDDFMDRLFHWTEVYDAFPLAYIKNPIYVVERFSLYPHMSETLIHDTMVPAQVIGMLRLSAYHKNVSIVYQTAQAAKVFATDDLLKEYGFYVNNVHERDAARHAFYYLATHKV